MPRLRIQLYRDLYQGRAGGDEHHTPSLRSLPWNPLVFPAFLAVSNVCNRLLAYIIMGASVRLQGQDWCPVFRKDLGLGWHRVGETAGDG
jgi:hypothetical protein